MYIYRGLIRSDLIFIPMIYTDRKQGVPDRAGWGEGAKYEPFFSSFLFSIYYQGQLGREWSFLWINQIGKRPFSVKMQNSSLLWKLQKR